jgi:four helix bundle protein
MEPSNLHENLVVYQRSLGFANAWLPVVDLWDRGLAVADQFSRAIESMLTNLAKANSHRNTDLGVYALECSLGSVYECAACLDVALVRAAVKRSGMAEGKRMLQPIAKMQMRLRHSWLTGQLVRERSGDYSNDADVGLGPSWFPHESLDVYKHALAVCRWCARNLLSLPSLPPRYARQIDRAATGVVLNIAEGNGRFSPDDHSRFNNTAAEAASTLAVYFELSAARLQVDVAEALKRIRLVSTKLEGLNAYLKKS